MSSSSESESKKSYLNQDEVQHSLTVRHYLKKFGPYIKAQPGLLVLTVCCVTLVALSSRLLPTIIGYAIDNGVIKKEARIMYLSALAFLIVEIIHSLTQFGYIYFANRLGNRVLFCLREDLMKHVQGLPMNYFDKTPIGRIVTRLNSDTATLGEVFSDGIINIITEFVTLIAIVVSLFLISPKLAAVTLFMAPFLVFFTFRITYYLRLIMRESKIRFSEMNSFLSENMSGIKVIQLYNRGLINSKIFERFSNRYKEMILKSIHQFAYLQPLMNLFNAVAISTALYMGGLFHQDNLIQMGALVAFIMHVQDFIPPLREILDKYQQFQNSLTSAERILNLLDEPIEKETGNKNEKDIAKKATNNEASNTSVKEEAPTHLSIEIKNLSFRYEEHLPEVLKNISFTIPKGISLALIGRTGSGKSTLISLLQRFYEVPENTVFFEGIPIEKYSRQELRRKIGVVQQDNFIFKGTIKENVCLFSNEISEERILWALNQVGYEKLLLRSGRTFNSPVEEKGANLSAGERQLIAFARILAFQPDTLILDEATANIDSESEKIIQLATKKIIQGRTSIIIAHRLSTIEECDQILTLDQGCLVDKKINIQ